MSYCLRTDEILEGLINAGNPRAAQYQRALEGLATGMAWDLANQLGIKAGPATFEGVAFAGTCACFFAASEGQEIPDAIAGFDSADEWSLCDD